jgi:hypothetical protein
MLIAEGACYGVFHPCVVFEDMAALIGDEEDS